MKTCRTCKISKSVEEFTKDKKYKDGLNTECKKCSRIRYKKSYNKHIEKRRAASIKYAREHKEERAEYSKKRSCMISEKADYIDRDEKKCYKCKETKLIEMFGKRSACVDGHDNICKPCQKARDRKRYVDNREKEIQRSIDYQKRNPYPSRLSKKRFRQKADLSGWDLYKWANAVKQRDENKCVECGSIENLEVHHIKGKAKYPDLALKLWNGITLCKSCHGGMHGDKNE